MHITFSPENESNELRKASEEYAGIWLAEGERICETIGLVSGLNFKDEKIIAVVLEGISQSHPLKLRASLDTDTKRGTLIHELVHRLSVDYMLKLPDEADNLSLGLHKQIDLILYDLWTQLYGEDFANEQVKIESDRTPLYKAAWEWALKFPQIERQQKFAALYEQ